MVSSPSAPTSPPPPPQSLSEVGGEGRGGSVYIYMYAAQHSLAEKVWPARLSQHEYSKDKITIHVYSMSTWNMIWQ